MELGSQFDGFRVGDVSQDTLDSVLPFDGPLTNKMLNASEPYNTPDEFGDYVGYGYHMRALEETPLHWRENSKEPRLPGIDWEREARDRRRRSVFENHPLRDNNDFDPSSEKSKNFRRAIVNSNLPDAAIEVLNGPTYLSIENQGIGITGQYSWHDGENEQHIRLNPMYNKHPGVIEVDQSPIVQYINTFEYEDGPFSTIDDHVDWSADRSERLETPRPPRISTFIHELGHRAHSMSARNIRRGNESDADKLRREVHPSRLADIDRSERAKERGIGGATIPSLQVAGIPAVSFGPQEYTKKIFKPAYVEDGREHREINVTLNSTEHPDSTSLVTHHDAITEGYAEGIRDRFILPKPTNPSDYNVKSETSYTPEHWSKDLDMRMQAVVHDLKNTYSGDPYNYQKSLNVEMHNDRQERQFSERRGALFAATRAHARNTGSIPFWIKDANEYMHNLSQHKHVRDALEVAGTRETAMKMADEYRQQHHVGTQLSLLGDHMNKELFSVPDYFRGDN